MNQKCDLVVSEPKLEDERKAVGSIDAKVYWDYFRAGAGPVLLSLTLMSTLVCQALFHYSDIWLSDWYHCFSIETRLTPAFVKQDQQRGPEGGFGGHQPNK